MMTVIFYLLIWVKNKGWPEKREEAAWRTIQDKDKNYMQMQNLYTNYMQSFWCPR